ncbi:MAG: transcription antitermination factor NusB [Erysipelotrichaceae bacterium]|nr:transcription antitermination factor NusB [Erysipelotrichaceae bacterium]
MNRHKERECAMMVTYQYLLVARDIDELIEDAFKKPVKEVDPYFVDVIHDAIDNMDKYHGYIDDVIKKGWTFERLGAIEKAILLNGCAEFDLKQTEAAVIIDESVDMAKKYCDSDTYKLINSVLDVI